MDAALNCGQCRAATIATAVAVDAVATWLLLRGAPLNGAALHLLVVSIIGFCAERPSDRLLCLAAAAAVPGAGPAVAAVVIATRGRGTAALALLPPIRTANALTPAAAERLGEDLSPCDALDGGNEDQRRAALAKLVRRADPEATALLRWVAGRPEPELAMAAALALDEIEARGERAPALRA
jgi:hypothetical protein